MSVERVKRENEMEKRMRNRDKKRIEKGRERGESFKIETQTFLFVQLETWTVNSNSLHFIGFQPESSCLKKIN